MTFREKPIKSKTSHDELLEDKLAQTQAELNSLRDEFAQFAYIVSHDLSAPIRHINSFSHMILEDFGKQLDEDSQHRLSRILNATDRARGLINDLLTYSRLNTHIKEFTSTPLRQCYEDAYYKLELAIHDKNIEIECGELPEIPADSSQLALLFYHLLDNAVKFRHPDHNLKLTIKAELKEKNWHIDFIDNGIGLNEKHYDRALEAFQKVYSGGEYTGNGIGLAIVNKIAQRHGGKAFIRNNPDQGVTVTTIVAA